MHRGGWDGTAVPPPRILHLHSTFDLGGKEARDVALMNAWGGAAEHVIVSGEPQRTGAAALIDACVPHRIATEAPPLSGAPSPARLAALGRWIARGGFDLVLSFNWGAIDGLIANRALARRPHVHHEDGFNEDEATSQKAARRWLRRIVLPGIAGVVVPSRTLETIARATWGMRPPRLHRVPNGIDAAAFAVPPSPHAIPGLERRPGEVIVGTLAGLRRVKNLPRLVRAFAAATRATEVPARLVIVGQGPDRDAIRREAVAAGVAERVVMPGFLPHPAGFVGLFDIFALSSDSEQFPISLVEAMAASRPAVSTRVGDVAEIVGDAGAAFLADPDDETALAGALARLIADPALRAAAGTANVARVARHYTKAAMVTRYASIYGAAMGRTLP